MGDAILKAIIAVNQRNEAVNTPPRNDLTGKVLQKQNKKFCTATENLFVGCISIQNNPTNNSTLYDSAFTPPCLLFR
jgi:hypothetical protein